MSNPLPPELTSETQRKDAPGAQVTTGPTGPENLKDAQPKRKSHHKKITPTISDSGKQLNNNSPVSAAALGPGPVKVEVESHPDKNEGGGLIGLLKTAKARAEVNEDATESKKTGRKPEGSTKAKAKTSGDENKEEFTTLVFTVLTIVLSFANLPPEIRPVEDELKSLAYNIGSIVSRHVPALGNLSPDLIDIMGITGTLALWYQRVGPELKRIQAEKSGTMVKAKAEAPGGGKSTIIPEDQGPANPIKDVSTGAGEFLDHVHKGGDNGR